MGVPSGTCSGRLLTESAAYGRLCHMRRRTPITRDQILEALEAAGHDVELAAVVLSQELGTSVSGRTLYRRMAELGVKRSDRYEAAQAA